MHAKFGCSQTVVSIKGGVKTDTHTHKGTLQHYIVDGNAIVMDFWSRTQCEVTVWIGKGRVTNRI